MNSKDVILTIKENITKLTPQEIEEILNEFSLDEIQLTQEYLNDIYKSLDETLKNYKLINAFITPIIEGRDNGGDTDGTLEIVEPDEVIITNNPDNNDFLNYYVFTPNEVKETYVLKLESEDWEVYQIIRYILEKENIDYCGISATNTIYIPVND